MRICIIRHAKPCNQTSREEVITPEGEEKLERLAAILKGKIDPKRIMSSDFDRSLNSAKSLKRFLGIESEIEVEPGLGSCSLSNFKFSQTLEKILAATDDIVVVTQRDVAQNFGYHLPPHQGGIFLEHAEACLKDPYKGSQEFVRH